MMNAATEADRGNAGRWKAWKTIKPFRFFSGLEPCLVGIEAGGSAHHWARVLSGLGHTVRLMAP